MGYKYYVCGWQVIDANGFYLDYKNYEWTSLYQGNSLIKVLWVYIRNRKKFGSVKLESHGA